MSFVGMDTKVVRQISSGLGVQANHIGSITSTIQALLGQSMQLWQGQDAVDFSHTWASTHRPMLESLRQHLEEMATAASVNADQQDGVSGDGGATGAAIGSPAAGAIRGLGGLAGGPPIDLDGLRDFLVNGWTAGVAGGLVLVGGAVAASGSRGGATWGADASYKVGVDGSAGVKIGMKGIDVNAGVRAGVSGSAGVQGEYSIASGGARADGFAGARANADGHLGLDGARGSAGAFAGATISGTAQGEVGGVGGKATAEGWAGAGVRADGTATFSDGKLVLGGHVGAALGLGGSIGGEVTIDTEEMKKDFEDAADAVGDFFHL